MRTPAPLAEWDHDGTFLGAMAHTGANLSDWRGANDAVGASIRARRVARGWTQDDLATTLRSRGLAWQRVTVAEAERGARMIHLDELVLLAEVFDVRVKVTL